MIHVFRTRLTFSSECVFHHWQSRLKSNFLLFFLLLPPLFSDRRSLYRVSKGILIVDCSNFYHYELGTPKLPIENKRSRIHEEKNHLHFDVKSVIDSFDFFMNGKKYGQWLSNWVEIYWHTKPGKLGRSTLTWILSNYSRVKNFHNYSQEETTWISIQKTTSFSSNNENTFTIKTRSRSSHKNSGLINLPRKLAFDNNNRALREKPVFVFEYYEKKIGFNFQSHLHTKSSRVDKQFSFLSTLLYAKSSCANFTPL